MRGHNKRTCGVRQEQQIKIETMKEAERSEGYEGNHLANSMTQMDFIWKQEKETIDTSAAKL